MRISPPHLTFPHESTTSTKCPASKENRKIQSTLKLHCSECCPVGFVDVVVAAGQCSHPRLKEPLCILLDNECKLHQNYFSLFSRCFSQYVYMHDPHRTRRLTGFLCTEKYQTTACLQSGSVELMLQVMSINSM